ncbi:MAG: hypothetical protein SFX73_26175 [Kofleriaceae bacterium]|nr:hypothetical protein [Kofleriaceae bacterium]
MHVSAKLLLVIGLWSCGPGLRPEPIEPARNVFAENAATAEQIQTLLRDSVTNGGLWFDDARCAEQFPAGEIHADRFASFAQCLAGLKMRASERVDALPDVVVMTYGPGFEVEARIIQNGGSSQLAWIGFASRHADRDAAPTLSASAFAALRVSGQVNGKLSAEVARTLEGELDPAKPKDVAQTWLKVCVDETGAIASVTPYETSSPKAQEIFVAVAREWSFRPFVLAGQPVPVCSMVRMVHPLAKAEAVETLPLPPPPSRGKRAPLVLSQVGFSKLQEGRRIAGSKRIVPDDETKVRIQKAMNRQRSSSVKLTARFRLCVDEAGQVESVLPLSVTGYPKYDQDLMAGMRQWVYAPYKVDDQPVPVCTAITFIYSQR